MKPKRKPSVASRITERLTKFATDLERGAFPGNYHIVTMVVLDPPEPIKRLHRKKAPKLDMVK